jgi:hypothetical protein
MERVSLPYNGTGVMLASGHSYYHLAAFFWVAIISGRDRSAWMIEKIFMHQHLTRCSLGGIGWYKTCSWKPAVSACLAGVALRSWTGFEGGYSLSVINSLGDDDELRDSSWNLDLAFHCWQHYFPPRTRRQQEFCNSQHFDEN